jgi:hypothetical protein
MSTVTTRPTRTRHRTQIITEAVVSAYIHEIAPSGRGRERARRGCAESPNGLVRAAMAAQAQRRSGAKHLSRGTE